MPRVDSISGRSLWRRALETWLVGQALASVAWAGAAAEAPPRPNLVLITLDTTRDDFVGSGAAAGASRTPAIDRLASQGVRYLNALAASPLTLPSHASLLTGLEPPEHGLRDNGSSALPLDLPTLATVLAGEGYRTAAFVASRVLDRRFGLARGFATYDDRMVAERTGEYGYPERDAAAVTTAALAWLGEKGASRPFFLWAHYYDPHFPYAAPGSPAGQTSRAAYADEVAYMDREVGRLLDAVPRSPAGLVVALVGDHGEALGEHGERTHGVFLYRPVMQVPLILAGSGVPRGAQVSEVVATRRLAASVIALLLAEEAAPLPGPVLPGLGLGARDQPPVAVYHETLMPAMTYGWSPLTAISDSRYRLIRAPRPELYDVVADPGEERNILRDQPAVARRLRDELAALEASFSERPAVPLGPDGELAADLRALGYLSSGSPRRTDLDPKDGVVLLARLAQADARLRAGQAPAALALLEELNARSPGNVPFLVRLASAQQSAGREADAIATFQRAIGVDPNLEFLHLHLGRAYLRVGRLDEAEAAFRSALEIDPRFADAWLSLAELSHRRSGAAAEREVLESARSADVASVAVLVRLAQLAMAQQDQVAETYLAEACELLPELPLPWLLRGRVAMARGDRKRARSFLDRAVRAAPRSAIANEARALLDGMHD